MTQPVWKKSSVFPAPGAREIHLWISRNPQPCSFRRFALSNVEEDRSSRFIRPGDREKYICAHMVLKTVLAGYSGLRPEEIRLGAGTGGKPCLEGRRSVSFSDFNMAHSGSIILVGVASGCRVGVDVEEIREDCDISDMAARYLHTVEAAIIETLDADYGRRAFFDLWTKKEAYSKARGEGLSLPPQSYSFRQGENDRTKVFATDGTEIEPCRWKIIQFEPAPGYSGAAAFDDPETRVRYFELDPGK